MAVSTEPEVVLESSSASETKRAGEQLGALLVAGDVVLLDGELGAGKTAFAEGLARGLGVPRGRRIGSPTFALVSEHPARVPLYHIDLYRIEAAAELYEIGIEEYLDGETGVAVVEWAERLKELTPRHRIEIRIEVTGDRTRRLHARAVGEGARRRLEDWRRRLSARGSSRGNRE